jgi:N6-L-threonylcarbamoyladenine synthase
LREKNNLDFSFSGLKTNLLYRLRAMGVEQIRQELPHLAASYESAVVEALVRKLVRAAELHEGPTLVVAGGVAANALLGIGLVIPPPELCTDNAAMIGAAAPSSPVLAYPNYLSLNARSV